MIPFRLVLFVALLILWLPATETYASNDTIDTLVVCIAQSSKIENIELKQLKMLYLGRQTQLSDGTEVRLGSYSPSADQFYHHLLNMSEMRIKKHWLRVVFSAEFATPPDDCITIEEVLLHVDMSNSAIVFLPLNLVNEHLKILSIDGYLPQHPKYPL